MKKYMLLIPALLLATTAYSFDVEPGIARIYDSNGKYIGESKQFISGCCDEDWFEDWSIGDNDEIVIRPKIEWLGESKLDFELGLRSDGVVVWRKVKP